MDYQIIDIFDEQWKVGFLRQDGLVSFGDLINWFACNKTAKFRTYTSLAHGNEDILNSYNFMNFNEMKSVLSKNPKSYLEFRSYLYYGFKQFLEFDMIGNPAYFSTFENIITDIFKYCLDVIKDSEVAFVDFCGKDNKECEAWPEIFYFFKFFFRMTEESRDFFHKYQGMITKKELICSQNHFLVSLGSLRSLEHLFDKKNCLRFVYDLEIFLEFKEEITKGLMEPNENMKSIVNPYRNMLIGFKKYLDTTSFEYYCPVRSRRIFMELVKIVNESIKSIQKNSNMDKYIETVLIELNFKAFKSSKAIATKVKLAEQIDSLLKLNEGSIEKLVSYGYFSLISEHSELIQNSSVFISYCLVNKKLKQIQYFKVLKKMQNETLKSLLNIQCSVNLSEKGVVEKVKKLLPESFKNQFRETFIRLLASELSATKNLKAFIEEVKKIENKKWELIIKYVLDVLLQQNFFFYTFQLFENIQFSENSFEFDLSCEMLHKISLDQFNLLVKNLDFYSKVLECPKNTISPLVHSKIINLVFRKQPNISQKRLEKIADIASNNEFLVGHIEEWVSAGLLNSNLEYFQNQIFCSNTAQSPMSEKLCFTFVKIFKSLYLVTPFKQISYKAADILIGVLFDYKDISLQLNELVTQILIEIMQVHSADSQGDQLNIAIESKIKTSKNNQNIKNFLKKALEAKVLKNENIILNLYNGLNSSNFEEFLDVFISHPLALKPILKKISCKEFNNYQNYLILKFFVNENYDYWNVLFEIIKEPVEFLRLGQMILNRIELYNKIFDLKNEFKPDTGSICRFVINCNFSGLDPEVSVENQLKVFIDNEEPGFEYIETLLLQGLTAYSPSVYNPFTLIGHCISKFGDNLRVRILSYLRENIDKLVKVKHMKPVRKFFVQFLLSTEIFDLNLLCTLILDQVYKYNYKSEDIFSNSLELLYSIFNHHSEFPVFSDLIEFLTTEMETSNSFLFKNVKSCGLAYKFILIRKGKISSFDLNFENFGQIIQSTKISKIKSYTKINKSVEKGLINPGNVCYTNASLLILSQIPAFIYNLQQNYDQSRPLTSSLFYFYSKLFFSSKSSINAMKILNKSQQIHISYNEQRDADEFMTEILALLSIEIGESVYDGLRVEANRQIVCEKCGYISKSIEKLNRIELESSENSTISQMLKSFGNKEKLDGENQYFCETCSVKVDALKHYTLKSVPNDVIFMIKRFSYNILLNQKTKLYDKIVMEEKIVIESEDQGGVDYHLVGIVVHSGNEDAGHYFYYKKTGLNWVYINDEQVEVLKDFKLSEFSLHLKNHDQHNSTPYLLLYSKQPGDIKLNLPDELADKILNKNSKYLQVYLFCRPDVIEVIIQQVKLNTDPWKVINYLLYSLVNIVQSELEFMKNSKRLLKIFNKIENTDFYIQYLLTPDLLQNLVKIEFYPNPQSYLFFTILQTLLLKASYELKLKFYQDFYQLITKNENLLKNLTLHYYLFYLIILNLQEVNEESLKQIFSYIIQPRTYTKIQYSLIYQYISLRYAKILNSNELSFYIINNIEYFLNNLSRSEFEAFSMVLANISPELIQELMTKISNSSNSIKYPLLISLFKILESKQKGYVSNYFNYFEWLFHSCNLNDYPSLILLTSYSLNHQERQKLSENYLIPRISSFNFLTKDLIQRIQKLNEDLISPQFTQPTQKVFIDPETSISYQILDQVQNIVLVKSSTEELTLKLLHHSN